MIRPPLETVSRRGFLKGMAGILAAGVAPAAIGSGILMPVRSLWTPASYAPRLTAYCTGWSITNNGNEILKITGIWTDDKYEAAQGIIVGPQEIVRYDALAKAWHKGHL